MKNIFLTGSRGIGKTILLNRVLKAFPGKIAGFRTVPVCDNYEKVVGFGILDINDNRGLEATNLIGLKQTEGIMAFPETFEELGSAILERGIISNPLLLIMDELGFLESQAIRFQRQVEACLDSAVPVLGVLKAHDSPFLNRIKERTDVLLYEVNESNRESLYGVLKKTLSEVILEKP